MTAFEQAKKTVAALKEKNLIFSCAESCTGGLISKFVTDVSGASAVFFGSVVSYDNSVKENVLGVDGDVLKKYGAVSAPVAVMMARGARETLKTDIAVGVTGIAGPESDFTKKPVGLIYIALCDRENTFVYEMRNNFQGECVRENNREAAAKKALEMAEEYAALYPQKNNKYENINEFLKKY